MKKKPLVLLFAILSLVFVLVSCGDESDVPDGMQLASDTKIVDYNLYVPEDWIVDTNPALAVSMAHVSASDRSNISVAQWNLTTDTSTVDKWWENEYKQQLIDSLNADITLEGKEIIIDGKSAKQYEFSAVIDGTTYKYMVSATVRNGSIYVITYTSNEENYDKNLDDVSAILENMKFN
jgi:hypothetical protein